MAIAPSQALHNAKTALGRLIAQPNGIKFSTSHEARWTPDGRTEVFKITRWVGQRYVPMVAPSPSEGSAHAQLAFQKVYTALEKAMDALGRTLMEAPGTSGLFQTHPSRLQTQQPQGVRLRVSHLYRKELGLDIGTFQAPDGHFYSTNLSSAKEAIDAAAAAPPPDGWRIAVGYMGASNATTHHSTGKWTMGPVHASRGALVALFPLLSPSGTPETWKEDV